MSYASTIMITIKRYRYRNQNLSCSECLWLIITHPLGDDNCIQMIRELCNWKLILRISLIKTVYSLCSSSSTLTLLFWDGPLRNIIQWTVVEISLISFEQEYINGINANLSIIKLWISNKQIKICKTMYGGHFDPLLSTTVSHIIKRLITSCIFFSCEHVPWE